MNIGYARISTSGQNLDRQIAALRDESCETIFRAFGAFSRYGVSATEG